jgi:Putative phage metallopeptidase
MPVTFTQPEEDTLGLLQQVRSQYHPELEAAGVKIGIIMAHAAIDPETGEAKGVAIKGYAGAQAAASVKIVPLKDRLIKKYAAEICLDGDNWDKLSEEEQIAILDHELTHLIVKDERDDLGYPKLKMRKEDFVAWGFWGVIQRHGRAAMECKALDKLKEQHLQLMLNFDTLTETKKKNRR